MFTTHAVAILVPVDEQCSDLFFETTWLQGDRILWNTSLRCLLYYTVYVYYNRLAVCWKILN